MSGRILLVEDDRDILRNVQKLLLSEGYIVDTAENGAEALSFLQKATELPGIIILDLMMPVMDGFQFREEQKKLPNLAHIPVVIMTADGHVDEKRVRTSAAAALRKPADIDDILETVKRIALK